MAALLEHYARSAAFLFALKNLASDSVGAVPKRRFYDTDTFYYGENQR